MTLDELDLNPKLAAGLVVAVLPYHVGRVEGVASLGRLVVFTLTFQIPRLWSPWSLLRNGSAVSGESSFCPSLRVAFKSVFPTTSRFKPAF